MRISPKVNNQNGFTLVEVLIAITILSILMMTVYSLINNSTETKDRITKEDRETIQVETAMNRIETDFSQIYSPLYHSATKEMTKALQVDNEESISEGGSSSNDDESVYEKSERFPEETENSHPVPVIEQPDKTSLIFLSSSNRRFLEGTKQSRYVWLKYSLRPSTLEEEEQQAPYELVRASQTENPYKKEFDWENVKEFVLLRNIKEFSFQFWNPETKKFMPNLTTLNQFAKTPRAMRIKLIWVDSSGTEREVFKTYRPLWPNFDTLKDAKEIQEQAKNQALQSGTKSSGSSEEEEE